jgi:hypothetical protein
LPAKTPNRSSQAVQLCARIDRTTVRNRFSDGLNGSFGSIVDALDCAATGKGNTLSQLIGALLPQNMDTAFARLGDAAYASFTNAGDTFCTTVSRAKRFFDLPMGKKVPNPMQAAMRGMRNFCDAAIRLLINFLHAMMGQPFRIDVLRRRGRGAKRRKSKQYGQG